MKSYVLSATAACFALMLPGMARASSVSFDPNTDTLTFAPNESGNSEMPPQTYYRDYNCTIVESTGGFLHIPVTPVIVIPTNVVTNTAGNKGNSGGNTGGNTGGNSNAGGDPDTDTNDNNNGNGGGDPSGNGPTDPANTNITPPCGPEMVPLPASSALAGVGLAGVILISWRRSRSMAV